MSDEVVIDRRFRGPPDSANGGYACGLVAGAFAPGGPAEVTLHAPPPLDRALARTRVGGGAELRDGERLVAAGEALARLNLELPDPVDLDGAAAARAASPLHEAHFYGECFVCGTDRGPGDGLGVVAGPVEGRELVAAPFDPDPALADDDGRVLPEIVWAVLDCPSGIALMLAPKVGVTLLGRMAAQLLSPLDVDRTYAAAGWLLGHDGRKHDSATALFDEDGNAVAIGRARWIEVRP